MSNYAEIKSMWEREQDPQKKARLKEALECMEEASVARGFKPGEWKTPEFKPQQR